jgi:hypothetical protein
VKKKDSHNTYIEPRPLFEWKSPVAKGREVVDQCKRTNCRKEGS